jgi:hypothetical protein
MATYKMVQSHTIIMVAGGDTPQEAIKATWERKYGVQIISVTQPYADKDYHIEHSGRMMDWYHDYIKDQRMIYAEDVTLDSACLEL